MLLEKAEDVLRKRGAASVGLGSVDEAVDFYLACGYVPQLLIQFHPDVDDPQAVIRHLLEGPLAEREVFETEWNGHPQLWLQERTIDWEFKRRVESVAGGVVAQYIMSKDL